MGIEWDWIKRGIEWDGVGDGIGMVMGRGGMD